MTAKSSKFQPFTLTLSNSATLSGIVYIPTQSQFASPSRPLLVLCHGGRCHAGCYDVNKDHSAAESAEAFSIPVVSINRPCYQQTSSIFPIPSGSSFHKKTGRWEHEYIFPALWEKYGVPNHCTALVAMGHSLATPGLLVAASLQSQSPTPTYPLAGLILSGWGVSPRMQNQQARLKWSAEENEANRHLLMFSEPALNAAEASMKAHLPEQTVQSPGEEAQECVAGPWSTYSPEIAAHITMPVMFGLGEHDCIVPGAPHAIEWSYSSRSWYARSMGFALSVATLPSTDL
ncbi:hypothetical protein M409DRAFT_71409 [Zasmidium cellare ATCC 36951]|uniref:AB hydrolase-1 domain-containing protein n=1 Tax=Zasmidium cellare ATCC 36951 TaxID=1080233 RepID=A0A6A6BXR2_ZASCE|nr:uncharacterized protein M409DRAFT_71409 [Zasmidium cellare ATCC 36951]KAF2158848.1 hypothetical protein M409DRAFT_71409 [Zasmidium cellare ATCC 36951]